jgi:hypothetical protein
MVVQCERCGHTASAVERPKSGLAALFSSEKIEYTCAKCGSGAALRKIQYCTKCGHVGVPNIVEVREISTALLIVLLFFGIIPGLIYLIIGGSTQPYYECTQCRGRLCLIPSDSPVAQSALGTRPQAPALSAATGNAAKFCSSCGTALVTGSRICGSCGQAIA